MPNFGMPDRVRKEEEEEEVERAWELVWGRKRRRLFQSQQQLIIPLRKKSLELLIFFNSIPKNI